MRVLNLLTVATALLLVPGALRANDELLKLQDDPVQWALPNGDFGAQRYSDLTQINKRNVAHLKAVWSFSTGVLRGHEGGPLVVGGILYLHTPFPNQVFALDLKNNGRLLWRYQPNQDPAIPALMPTDTVNRGLAYGGGKVFLYQADTTLVALDAKTGKPVWTALNGQSANGSKGETTTGAAFVFKDKVYVGISGGQYGVRGHVTAYDMATGTRIWRGYSMGPDSDTLIIPGKTTALGKPIPKESSLESWSGEQWQIGGGETSGWFTFDPKLNLIYYGSGSPAALNPVQRPGDNRWADSLWARDADTGRVRWIYQMTPHDEWGFDGVNEPILADLEIGGKVRPALVHFDRNGVAYTLERATGELLVAKPYDPSTNWLTHVDMKTGRPEVVEKYSPQHAGADIATKGICPASLGAKNQQPASFSGKTRLFYVPTNHACMDFEPFKVSYIAGQPFVGATETLYPAPNSHGGTGTVIAWDAATGKTIWAEPEKFAVWSGVLSTAGGVVFYGTLDGYLKAVDDATGRELFRYKTPSGIVGNVTTWSVNGKQYIGVLSGIGGVPGIGLAAGLQKDSDGLGAVGLFKDLGDYTALGGVLTVFALD